MIYFSLLFNTVCIVTFTWEIIVTLRTEIDRFQKRNLAFYFFMLLLGQLSAAGLIIAGSTDTAAFFYRIYGITATGFLFAVMPLAFSIVVDRKKIFITVFSVISFLVHSVLNIVFDPVKKIYLSDSGLYVPELTGQNIILNIIPIIFFVAGIVHLSYFIRKSKSTLIQHRLYYFMIATILIFLGLATNLTTLKSYPADIICTMLGGLLLSYSVLRKRLLRIKKTFFRGALALTLIAALTGLFILLLYLVSILSGVTVSYLSVIPAILCFIIILSVLSKRQKKVSKFLFTTDTIYIQSTKEFEKKIGKLQDFNSIFSTLYESLSNEFLINRLSIYMLDRTEGELTSAFVHPPQQAAGTGKQIKKTSPLMLSLNYNEILLVDEYRLPEDKSCVACGLKEVYGESPPDIILPIKISGEIIGIIIITLSPSEHFMDKEDIAFIQDLNNLTTGAVTRAIAYEQLEQEVFKKENLIKDINHRVKNNLQMISGLLALQGLSAENKDVISALNTAEQRIRTIAKIHEMLYIRGVVDNVNLKLYITEVLNGFSESAAEKQISVSTDISSIDIEAEKALTICLIINELVANAVKYAFTNRGSGTISITIQKGETTGLLCIISDNGIGYSREEIDGSGIGHSLVHNFITKQLKGRWETTAANGTTHKIHLP